MYWKFYISASMVGSKEIKMIDWEALMRMFDAFLGCSFALLLWHWAWDK